MNRNRLQLRAKEFSVNSSIKNFENSQFSNSQVIKQQNTGSNEEGARGSVHNDKLSPHMRY
jgi:hypothetical protein